MIVSISSLWPLASMPARPTISPARTSKRHVATAGSPRSSRRGDARQRQQRLARRRASGFSTRSSTSRPTISRASERSVAPSVGHRVDLLAAPQDGHAVGDVEHLVELVRDEDDRRALGRQRAQDAEQVLRLLGGEHRGRLVEHEHLRAAEQRAQDLHALLGADAEVLDAWRPGRPRGRSAPRARAPARPPPCSPAAARCAARRRARGSRPRSSPARA